MPTRCFCETTRKTAFQRLPSGRSVTALEGRPGARGHRLVAVVLALAAVFVRTASASTYDSSHPDVQGMVAKARQYLASSSTSVMGEAALVGLALIKSGSDHSDPKVQAGVAAIQRGLESKRYGSPVNYQIAISLIFLIENDPVRYRQEIQSLLDILLSRQEQHGGWSYWEGEGGYGRDVGDSSMSQYATLAVWSAKRAGFDVPQENAVRLANFWMRTQTPEGAWAYQGHPAPLGQRIAQSPVRASITMAGLSSCYVVGDLFGMAQRAKALERSHLPSALQKVQDRNETRRNYPTAAINADLMRQTMQLGDAWIEQDYHGYYEDTWIIYYMYAMERYRSFQEHYQGRQAAANAKWYDDGVEFLKKTQNAEGSWRYHMGGHVTASFAILFLMRSTRTTIEREYGDGLVRGGRGLPADISQVTIDEKTGVVINPDLAGTIENLMSILDDPNNANFDTVAANPDRLVQAIMRPKVDEDQAAREQRIERLKDMVSKGTYEQRLIAVKALARTGDLDQAPLLLYALTDGDPRVRAAAEEGLRFLSRNFDGYGLPEDPKSEEFEKMRLQWRDWYLALRPNGELLD